MRNARLSRYAWAHTKTFLRPPTGSRADAATCPDAPCPYPRTGVNAACAAARVIALARLKLCRFQFSALNPRSNDDVFQKDYAMQSEHLTRSEEHTSELQS